MRLRVAARAVIVEEARLLLVNAYPSAASDLWCAPGGGVDAGSSLVDNLLRELREETGLRVTVGRPCLVNEFFDPGSGVHQVEVFFRARIVSGRLDAGWQDPAGVVSRRRFFTRAELGGIRFKPDSLADVAFRAGADATYDPLEEIVR